VNPGKLTVEHQQDLFQQNLPADAKSDLAHQSSEQPQPSDKAPTGGPMEAGKRGQSQYAQFLRRSSTDLSHDRDTGNDSNEAQANGRPPTAAPTSPSAQQASPTAGASAAAAAAKGGAQTQKLERKNSRVHFVPSHAAEHGEASASECVQEAASHREQMMEQASQQQAQQPEAQQTQHAWQPQHAQQAQQRAQPEQKQSQGRQLHSKPSFQEILRQQIEVIP